MLENLDKVELNKDKECSESHGFHKNRTIIGELDWVPIVVIINDIKDNNKNKMYSSSSFSQVNKSSKQTHFAK